MILFMKKFFLIFFVSIFLGGSLLCVLPVEAKKTLSDANSALSTVSGKTGITEGEVTSIVGNVIKGILLISGLIFFVLMVYAGLVWMTAQGKDEQVEKGRKTLIAATIGLVIITGSYALTIFVQNILQANSTTPGADVPDTAGDDSPLGCCYDWAAATQAGELTGGIKANRGIVTRLQCELMGTDNPSDLINDKWEFYEGWDAKKCDENLSRWYRDNKPIEELRSKFMHKA